MITWYKNGHPIEKERKYFGERSLKITKVQFKDRGIYTCTAENILGRVELSINVSVKGMAVYGTPEKFVLTSMFSPI